MFIENNQLVIVRTNASDSGSYKCVAYNSYSSDEKSLNVVIEGLYITSNLNKVVTYVCFTL